MRKPKRRLAFPLAILVSVICLGATATSVSATTTLPDPNGDGTIDISDAVLVARYLDGQIATSTQSVNYDINENGIISQFDVKLILLYIAGIWNGG